MEDNYEHEQREQRWRDHDNAIQEKINTTDTRRSPDSDSGGSGGCLGLLIVGGLVGGMFFGSGDIEDIDIEKKHVRKTTITYNKKTREACTIPKDETLEKSCFNVLPGQKLLQVCNGYALSTNSIRWNKALCIKVSPEDNMSKKMVLRRSV